MKKTAIWNILCAVVLALQLVAEALTAAVILRLNMLPAKYTAVLIAALVMLGLLTGLLMFLRYKKSVGAVRRIVACVLALLVVCGCAVISKVVSDAYETMHAVTGTQTPTDIRNMYIFVREDDPAQTLEDTAGYRFAIVESYDQIHKEQIGLLIEEETAGKIQMEQYTTGQALVDALLAEEVDAIVMNGAGMVLLLEDEKYADLEQRIRQLYCVPLSQLEGTDSTVPQDTQPPVAEGSIASQPFVVYISGSDTRSSKLNVSRSDVNILAVVNPVTKQVLLLNTPRDYYVPNPAGNGKLDKLTHCGLYGTACSMEALGTLYGLQIDYYAQINFTGFKTLIDAVGGITVYSDQAFSAYGEPFQKGANHLDGERALLFSRERYNLAGGDRSRGKNQMKVITALIEKLTNGTTIISNYSQILGSLEGMFKTNVSMDQIGQLVKMQLNDMASWNVHSFGVSGNGGSEITYSAPGQHLYVMHQDEEMVAHAAALAQKVVDGQTLTAEDVKYS